MRAVEHAMMLGWLRYSFVQGTHLEANLAFRAVEHAMMLGWLRYSFVQAAPMGGATSCYPR